jgi:hypothetical protein
MSSVTVVVGIAIPEHISVDEINAAFQKSIPTYQSVQGLVRKYYLKSEDGNTAGGVYLFESREAAEKLFNEEWRASVKKRYGAEPEVRYFETPIVVDNLSGTVTGDT